MVDVETRTQCGIKETLIIHARMRYKRNIYNSCKNVVLKKHL